MKKIFLLLLGFIIYIPVNSQLITGLDEVSPFNEGLAAVKKGDQWAFMDKQGAIALDFRDDLVATSQKEGDIKAPVFKNGRALISRTEENITYFGYIDKSGKEVVKSIYVNATPFKNGFAVVMGYSKEVVGRNKVLGKNVVSYEIEEFVIDLNGKAMTPMLHTRNYVPDKMKSGKSPDFTTIMLGARMVAVKTSEQKWEVYKF
jgi:hypothetical protein